MASFIAAYTCNVFTNRKQRTLPQKWQKSSAQKCSLGIVTIAIAKSF